MHSMVGSGRVLRRCGAFGLERNLPRLQQPGSRAEDAAG